MLTTPELIEESAQVARMAQALPTWLAKIPLYRNRTTGQDPALLSTGPFITKRDIRTGFPENFLGPDADLEGLMENSVVELEQTSGTSEQQRTPLLLPFGWWARQEELALRLNPIVSQALDQAPHRRRLTLSSPVCNSEVSFTSVPSRSDRIVGDTLFSSLSKLPFLWGEADLQRIAREAQQWDPLFLDLDPAYGLVFARYCERHQVRLPSLKFILCSYEFLSVNHRRVLERVFGVPVFNLYGSTETGHLLMEVDRGLMRASLRTAHLQVLDEDARGIGDLIVTTLSNDLMPLIRYRIGDLCQALPGPYRTRYVVHGRAMDAIVAPSGRRVTVLDVDGCFAGLEGFAHYQLVPGKGSGWQLRFVSDTLAPGGQAVSTLRKRLRDLLESADLQVEPVEVVMPENSGKFRLVYPRSDSFNAFNGR